MSHGSRIGIRVNDPAVLERLSEHLPPDWTPSRSPVVDTLYSLLAFDNGKGSHFRRYNLLYVDGARLARTRELNELFNALESDVHFQVALTARRRLFVHAGAVGWNGHAIVVPGRSGSGKSTLVAALVEAGANYYSDEFAVLDAQGRVHPYPKPIWLREERGDSRRALTPEALGGRKGTRPLALGLVAITEYRSGVRFRPRALSPAETLLQLLANTVVARIRPHAALRVFEHAVRGCQGLKGRRGEAEEVAGELLRRLDRHVASGRSTDPSQP